MAGYGSWGPASAPHMHTSPLYRPDGGYGYDGGEAPYYTSSGLFHHGTIRQELQDFYSGAVSFFRDEDDEYDRDLDPEDIDDMPQGLLGWWASRMLYLVDRNAGKVKNQALVRPCLSTLLHACPAAAPPS